MFAKVVDKDYIDTLMQNILSHEHVIDKNDKSLTTILEKVGLFCYAHFE
jgi:hypothetical protein